MDDAPALTGVWTEDTMSGCAGNHYYVDNDDTAQAEWRFTVASGSSYLVMTTWNVWDENVSDALFAVYDGVALEDELPVNLTASPGDVVEAGREWRQLGAFTVTSSGLDNLRVTLAGNSAGRVVADAVRIVEVGPTVRNEYNIFGELLSETDALGNTTHYQYDQAGRLIQITLPDPDGAGPYPSPVIERAYDTFGNLVSETNPLCQVTSHTYDALHRRTSTTDANNHTTVFTYNLQGQMTSLTDPSGNVTAFVYDDLGRLVSEEVLLDGIPYAQAYEYDLAGNLVREVDRNGRVRDYGYDALNREIAELWYADLADASLGVNAQNAVARHYDVLGRVTAESDLHSSYAYAYDTLDRVVGVTASHFADIGPITLASDYSQLNGLRTSLLATINGVGDFVNHYVYDDLDRLISVTQTGAGGAVADKRVDFGWRVDDLPDAVTRYADAAGTQLVAATALGYDEQSRLTGITHSQAATTLASYDLVFDAASRLTTFTSLADGAVDYSYDSRGQLVAADYADVAVTDESYSYNANGNRTNAGYVTADHNRYTSDGVFSYLYDAEGNRTLRTAATGETVEYQWDLENRLTRIVERDAGGAVTKTVDYVYDLQGRRIAKTVDDGATVEQERYVYDGEHIALQFDGSGDLTHRYLHGPAIDQILADEQLGDPAVAGDVLWPLTDHLGTVRDLAEFDDVSGVTSIANHIAYDAFGNVLSETAAAVDHIFGYTGRERDDESDLYFYRARYYDPAIGQFISEDPIGFEAGDANTRRYVGNSPTTSTDPSGLEEFLGDTPSEGRVIRTQQLRPKWAVERYGGPPEKIYIVGWNKHAPNPYPNAAEMALFNGDLDDPILKGALASYPWGGCWGMFNVMELGLMNPVEMSQLLGTSAIVDMGKHPLGVTKLNSSGARPLSTLPRHKPASASTTTPAPVSSTAKNAPRTMTPVKVSTNRSAVLVEDRSSAMCRASDGRLVPRSLIRQYELSSRRPRLPAPSTTPAPRGIKNVAIVGPKGKLGEFDEVLPNLFVEDKAGAANGIREGMKFTGKSFDQAANAWAVKNIYRKTKVRIENLPKATATIAEEGGSRVVPHLDEIKGIRNLHFKIEGDDPILMRHVNDQINQLRTQFPDWNFTVEFGT